jgi:hypothetical protein
MMYQKPYLKHLEKVTMAEGIKAFVQRHPTAQPSLKSTITRGEWIQGVRANDISRVVLARSSAMVKTVDTIEGKLKIRPDMRYLIDWCIDWIKSERAAGRNPTYTGMDDEWNRLRDAGDPFFQRHGVSYAKNNLFLKW